MGACTIDACMSAPSKRQKLEDSAVGNNSKADGEGLVCVGCGAWITGPEIKDDDHFQGDDFHCTPCWEAWEAEESYESSDTVTTTKAVQGLLASVEAAMQS